MKMSAVKIIDVSDFDEFISELYGRPYSFQQQDDCKPRGVEFFTIPVSFPDDFENDTVPEEVNHPEMGVSFKAWLARDPKQKLTSRESCSDLDILLWWDGNFYPHVDQILCDLYSRGILEPGKYGINIDW